MLNIQERAPETIQNPGADTKILFNDAADGLLKTKDSSGVVETLATTEGIAATEPKVYVALLTQTGTDAPVATVLENTLGSVPIWSYEGIGLYSITLSNTFTVGKTTIFVGNYWDGEAVIAIPSQYDINIIYFNVSYAISANSGDSLLNSTPVEIRVYP